MFLSHIAEVVLLDKILNPYLGNFPFLNPFWVVVRRALSPRGVMNLRHETR